MSKNQNEVKETTEPIEPKTIDLEVLEVETDAVIVKVDGWRMRVYFRENIAEKEFNVGQVIKATYTGDINDAHSVRFEKLNSRTNE